MRAVHLKADNTLWEVYAWLHEDATCSAAIAGRVCASDFSLLQRE